MSKSMLHTALERDALEITIGMKKFDEYTEYLKDSTDMLILDTITMISNIKIENDEYLKGHLPIVRGNIKSGIIFNIIKETAKQSPEYAKHLLNIIHYDLLRNGQKQIEKGIIAYRTLAECGKFNCPKEKECQRNSNFCFLEKYAKYTNLLKELQDKYNLEDWITESTRDNLLITDLLCNPDLQNKVVGMHVKNIYVK